MEQFVSVMWACISICLIFLSPYISSKFLFCCVLPLVCVLFIFHVKREREEEREWSAWQADQIGETGHVVIVSYYLFFASTGLGYDLCSQLFLGKHPEDHVSSCALLLSLMCLRANTSG